MRWTWGPFVILACLATLSAAGTPTVDAAGPDPQLGPPEFDVAWERDALTPGQAAAAEIWLANPADTALSGAAIELGAPDFLKLDAGDCPGTAEKSGRWALRLAPLPAGGLVHCRARIVAEPAIVEGEFEVQLGLTYPLQPAAGTLRRAFSLKSHKIKLSLFGSQSVAGVDLALLSYLVPGLLLLLALKFFGAPIGLTREDAGIASVSFSLLMLYAASDLGGETTSRPRFFLQCLASLLVAAVLGAPWLLKRARDHRRKHLLLGPKDSACAALEKAFFQKRTPYPLAFWKRAAADELGPVRLQLGKTFLWGSATAQAEDATTSLLGWVEVDPGEDRKLRQRLQSQLQTGELG